MAATVARAAARRWDNPLLALAIGVVVVVSMGVLPTLLLEQARDWIAYQQAAQRLSAGAPLYDWMAAAPSEGHYLYLYPPGMAAVWLAVGDPTGFLLVKVAALLSVATLAPMVAGEGGRRGTVALLLAIGALLWPPNLYDLILGNVMALYVGAAAVVIARRGWLGAAPLGVVLALAAKPAAVPLLLWLLVRHRRDAARVLAWALAASAVVAACIGPGRYLEYLAAIPHLGDAVGVGFSGNVGLVTVSPAAAVVGVAAGWLTAIAAARWLAEPAGAAVALGAMLIAQPTIGFNYAGLLYPALALLCARDRRVGLLSFAVVTPLTVVTPVGASMAVMAVGAIEGRRR